MVGCPLPQNEGNFLELLKLLAQDDALLEEHMRNLVGRVTYLSNQSQSEFISALASKTQSYIITEVKIAKFVDKISSLCLSGMSLKLATVSGTLFSLKSFQAVMQIIL